jgi:hypothetical protein
MVFAKSTVGRMGKGSPACNCLPVLDQAGPFLGRKGVLNVFHPTFEATKKKLPPTFLTANAGGLCVSSHKHIKHFICRKVQAATNLEIPGMS